MHQYHKKIEIRWADLDPNFHVLHSKYYDFGAFSRMSFFTENGITVEKMQEFKIGPIIFREECLFKKEIRFGDEVNITLTLEKISKDFRKWTLAHEIWINGDTLAALITIDGSWMNTQLRKLTVPPALFGQTFDTIPKAENFRIFP